MGEEEREDGGGNDGGEMMSGQEEGDDRKDDGEREGQATATSYGRCSRREMIVKKREMMEKGNWGQVMATSYGRCSSLFPTKDLSPAV